MMTADARRVTAIDRYIANRVQKRRVQLQVSQEALGGAISLSVQQIAKYEAGTNRIPAGRLKLIAEALDVEVAYFYEGCPRGKVRPIRTVC